ncbi:hypothetical protein PFLUV_G00219520 [Perca fluviatilis]|uniref:Sulfotransferase n=1 Tax=Perca fluviatilis TaxID=8168 RepID=A0A6A5EAS2_PERFL|nr:hypothetical protein PFLUV_G00219520 [Perca fluviatilis]
MEAREDDVMLVAYPKCGFNWTSGVLRKIIAEATGIKIESEMPPLIELYGPDVVKVLDEMPSPWLLGTHLLPDNIPKSFNAKKTKDLSDGVRQISTFFGFSLTEAQVQKIAERSTFT